MLIKQKEPKLKPSSFDVNAAKFLAKKMKEQRLIRGMPNIAKWSDEFRRLRRTFKEDEIKLVLIWFCKHVKDDFVPKVFCAAEFCRRFPQIQMAVQRGTDSHDSWPSDLLISDDAKKIAVRLGGLYWPKDEKPDELKLIQASLDGHKAWMNLCRAAKVKHPDQAGLIDCLLAFGGDANQFVEQWVASVHRIAWTNEQWAGKLARHAASMKHPRFQKIITGWICEYKGEGDWWPWFEKLLQGDGK